MENVIDITTYMYQLELKKHMSIHKLRHIYIYTIYTVHVDLL